MGGTVNACTKGIYAWGKPFPVTSPTGEEVSVILLDTEGIGKRKFLHQRPNNNNSSNNTLVVKEKSTTPTHV